MWLYGDFNGKRIKKGHQVKNTLKKYLRILTYKLCSVKSYANRPVTQFASVYSRCRMAVDTRYAYEAREGRYVCLTVNTMPRLELASDTCFTRVNTSTCVLQINIIFTTTHMFLLTYCSAKSPSAAYIVYWNYANFKVRITSQLMAILFPEAPGK